MSLNLTHLWSGVKRTRIGRDLPPTPVGDAAVQLAEGTKCLPYSGRV